MKAVQFSEYGGPEVLHVSDVEEPHAGAGQIRVAVRGAGVNPVDWKVRSGAMQQFMPIDLPSIPGSDVAGVVDEVGDGVTDVSVGDEVFGFAVGGAAAEEAVLEHYAKKPAGMSWAEAAGLPVAVETAVRTLDLLGLEPGQTILVNGAAGGVGSAAVQFARARGARVIGTASEGNHEFLRTLGAEPTTYGDGMVDRVRALAPEGVDRRARHRRAGRAARADRDHRKPGQRRHHRRLQRGRARSARLDRRRSAPGRRSARRRSSPRRGSSRCPSRGPSPSTRRRRPTGSARTATSAASWCSSPTDPTGRSRPLRAPAQPQDRHEVRDPADRRDPGVGLAVVALRAAPPWWPPARPPGRRCPRRRWPAGPSARSARRVRRRAGRGSSRCARPAGTPHPAPSSARARRSRRPGRRRSRRRPGRPGPGTRRTRAGTISCA